jgi:hypothetical protein
MTRQYRYPGAQPFQSEQQSIFFGRERDTNNFFQFLKLEKTVVLYSRSGLGKSSLLNAGVIPRIRLDKQLIPIVVRFGAYSTAKEEGPVEETLDSINSSRSRQSFLVKLLPNDLSIWSQLKDHHIQDSEKRGFVLIFDQFEELFTYPLAAIDAFKKELAEAVYSTIPQRFLDQIKSQLEGTEEVLTSEEIQALHQPFVIKVVVAIRSDRMHYLNDLADHLPDLLKNWFELGPLNHEEAEDAIINPAYKKENIFRSPPFEYSDASIEKILYYLTRDNTQNIESFQLQLLCQSLEQKVMKESISIIQEDDIIDIEDLYENYYENQINLLDTDEERLAARRLIEEGLIFEEEERRLILYEGQISKEFGVSSELLAELVNSHLIRAEPSLRGGYVYELSHDTLVAPILAAKAKRLEIERRHTEETIRLEREKELFYERSRRRRATMLAIIGFALAGIALITSLVAIRQSKIARAAEQRAKEALYRFQQEKKAKDQLRLEQFLRDAETYENAGEAQLARQTLILALEIDSTNQEVQAKLKSYDTTIPPKK